MSMEGKFKWLAEKVLDETKGGKVPENKIEPPVDDQGKEEKFEEATVKAAESAQTLQHVIYGLFEHVDSPAIKVNLAQELIDVIEEIGAEQGHMTHSLEYVHLHDKKPSINPLYHEVQKIINKYGYQAVREAALDYQMIVNTDWDSDPSKIPNN